MVELVDTRRSERRAAGVGVRISPRLLDKFEYGERLVIPAGPHKPGPPGSNPGLATHETNTVGYAILAKRPGREPGDCGFEAHPRY